MKLNFVAIILQNLFLLVYGNYYPIVIFNIYFCVISGKLWYHWKCGGVCDKMGNYILGPFDGQGSLVIALSYIK